MHAKTGNRYITTPLKLIPLLIILLLTGCATTPPSNVNDLCEIFSEKKRWYKDAKKSAKRWGAPINVQMAIIHQESRFKQKAKTKRTKLFFVIPWKRQSSAYGYAQVKDETWDWYKKKRGNRGADRDNFGDAVDFVGWYVNLSAKQLKISKWDARNQYLAYHEGHGGYKKKTYKRKKWLVNISHKVQKQAEKYGAQLKKCEKRLNRWWW